MIVEIIALIGIALAGVPIAMLLDRQAGNDKVLGLAILLGIGTTAAVLFVESMIGLHWSRAALIVPLLAMAAAASAVARRHPRPRRDTPVPSSNWWTALFSLLTVAALIGYTLFATAASLWEFDFLVDWGLKARSFFITGGVDWSFLQQTSGRAVHADYPLLLPLAFDALAVLRGTWNDTALGLVNVAFAIALLLVLHRVFRDEGATPTAAAALTFALVPFAASPWIGLAEAPLVAYTTAATLLIRSGEALAAAAVLLGLAASTKNEGLTFVVAVAIALVVSGRRRDLPPLWPAVVIPLPWVILRAAHGLQTDLATGNVLSRIIEHVTQPAALLQPLAHHPVGKPLFWVGVIVALAVLGAPFLRKERFALTTLVLQFLFYIGAYLASPHDLDWHLRWSWDRLVAHLTPLLATVLLLHLLPIIRRPATAVA